MCGMSNLSHYKPGCRGSYCLWQQQAPEHIENHTIYTSVHVYITQLTIQL